MISSVRVDSGDSAEARVLWGLLSDARVLSALSHIIRPGLFGAPAAGCIAQLAARFWATYRRPPLREIVAEFDAWAASGANPDDVKLTGLLLEQLFARYEDEPIPLAHDVLISEAGALFRRNALFDLGARISAEIENRNVDQAERIRAAFRPPEVAPPENTSFFGAPSSIWDAIMDETIKPIVEFPHLPAVDNFFRSFLCKNSFVSFLAPEKKGKSWLLQWIAWEALLNGRNVLYVEAGDSSESQVRERLAPRMVGRPLWAGRYRYPVRLEVEGVRAQIDHEIHEYRDDLSPDDLRIAARRLAARHGPDSLRLWCRPTGTVSVATIDGLIERYAAEGWVDPVIVIDYADILAPANTKIDTRDQINEIWRDLRGLSLRWDTLVVTATQSNKGSYDGEWTLARKHITEDKRKLSHVTALVAINQTEWEKENEIYRLNVPVGRRLTFGESTCLWMAGNLSYSRPAILAQF